MKKRIIFLRTSSRPVPRVLRFMEISRQLGLEPEFWGAYRDKKLSRTEEYEGEKINRKGPFFPLVNGTQGMTYFKGVFAYCRTILNDLKKIKETVAILHVSDAEPFLGALAARIFLSVKVIYNIHDNLSQRYSFPKVVNFVLNQIEGFFVVCATVAVVPEEFRRKALPFWCRWNVRVAKNSPMSASYSKPRKLLANSSVNILYAGWLDDGRCIEQLLELAGREKWINVIIAGDGDPVLHTLIEQKISESHNITYKGYVGNSEAIRLTKEADFIFANYKANRVINIYSASNKIAEALCTGRPVIINKEIEISKLISKYQCGVVEKYNDIQAIINKLEKYRNEKGLYELECNNARRLYIDEYSWDKVQTSIENILKKCTRGQK